ncbi:MAG: mechanosensitive ion channel [Muribaculaceae bacterium]|nr:mechanosensitive ion channel [Muribaculaceae bacterium]
MSSPFLKYFIEESSPLIPEAEIQQFKALSIEQLLSKLAAGAVQFGINLVIAIVVFAIGKFIIDRIYNFVSLILFRRNVDRSLSSFILSFIRIVLYFVLLVTCIGIIGIETSSFLALFASAGVAVGMALSGTLQNFAGGVLILFLKPYRVGDYIEAQGFAGTVKEIQIFHTLINTTDNKAIIIPNGPLSTSSINNWSRERFRRVSWEISISYDDKVQDARDAVAELFEQDPRIVKGFLEDHVEPDAEATDDNEENTEPEETEPEEPKKLNWIRRWIFSSRKKRQEAVEKWKSRREEKLRRLVPKTNARYSVVVNELADSAVVIKVRAWVRTKNYWAVFYEYNEKFYDELPKHNIHFPFPQMDVHLNRTDIHND